MATPTLNNGLKTEETKVRYFDIESFQNESKAVKFSYAPFSTIEEAKNKLWSIFDGMEDAEKKMLEAVNDLVRSKAMMEARSSALPENAADRKLVNGFVANFGQLPPFDRMPDSTPEERKAKRANILAAIKATPMILEGLKAKAKSSPVNVEDDEDEEKQ